MIEPPSLPPIRQIACATTDYFATAAFEEDVALWSLRERRQLARFNSTLDFGGKRMALVGGPRVVTAAYHVHGVSAFNENGSMLWQRRDLKRPQRINPITFEDRACITVGFDDTSLRVLDAATGETVETIRGVREAWHTGSNAWLLCTMAGLIGRYERTEAKLTWSVPLRSFALLDTATCDDAVLISEAGGPVRCFSTDGVSRWEWAPSSGAHAISLSWNQARSLWLCLNWSYEQAGPLTVLLDTAGRVAGQHILEAAACAEFFGDGEHIVVSDGTVRSAITGEVEWRFAS